MSLEANIESLTAALEKNTASVQSLEKTIKEQIDVQRQIVEGQGRILEQAQQANAAKGAKASTKAAATKTAEPAAEKKAEPAPATKPEETNADRYVGQEGLAKLKAELTPYLNLEDGPELNERKTKFAKLLKHLGASKGIGTLPEDKRSEFAGVIYGLSKGEDFPEIFGETKSEEDDLLG